MKILLVLMLLLPIAACSGWTLSESSSVQVLTGGEPEAPAVPPLASEILIFAGDELPDEEYDTLGAVTVTATGIAGLLLKPTTDTVDDLLREEALSIGADAVLAVEYTEEENAMTGSGFAVRFIDW